MKKQFSFLLLAAIIFAANFAFAQAPNSFNYQAVLRDGSGNLITSGLAAMKFTIRTGTSSGTSEYQETQNVTPNQYGLVNCAVGAGTVLSGTMAGITWGSGNKYLQVEVNTGGGFVNLGTQQLVSVPYALSSGDNQWTKIGNSIINTNTGSVISATPTVKYEVPAWAPMGNKTVIAGNWFGEDTTYPQVRFTNALPGFIDIGQNSSGDFVVEGNDNARLVVTNDGKVGIGTATPQCPLEVTGSVPINVGGWFHEYTSSTIFYNNGSVNVGIKSGLDVLAPGFLAASDIRIKNDIERSQSVNDLSTINQLKVTNYHYIDKVEKGSKLQKGFIAQEVKKVIPEAITTISEFIPNIYAVADKVEYKEGGKVVITTKKPHALKVNDEVRIITATKNDYKVEKVIDENKFEVSGLPVNTKDVFVYGKKVDDFNVVNYDRIFTTGIGAIQELSKQIEVLKTENAALQTELSSAKSANASLAADVAFIKGQLSIRSEVSPK